MKKRCSLNWHNRLNYNTKNIQWFMHTGHRDSKNRFLREGLDSLNSTRFEPFILFIPRRDTNKLAHTLIIKYGHYLQFLRLIHGSMTVPGMEKIRLYYCPLYCLCAGLF